MLKLISDIGSTPAAIILDFLRLPPWQTEQWDCSGIHRLVFEISWDSTYIIGTTYLGGCLCLLTLLFVVVSTETTPKFRISVLPTLALSQTAEGTAKLFTYLPQRWLHGVENRLKQKKHSCAFWHRGFIIQTLSLTGLRLKSNRPRWNWQKKKKDKKWDITMIVKVSFHQETNIQTGF